MEVLGRLESYQASKYRTKHSNQRNTRLEHYKDLLSTDFIDCFIVDKHHKNGREVHAINKHGLIYIFNERTKKHITTLHGRPSQLKRYYRNLRLEIPSVINKIAREAHTRNEQKGFNKV